MLKRIYYKLFVYPKYDRQSIDVEEQQKFAQAGFDVSKALSELDIILMKVIGRRFDFKIDSIHWLIWAAIKVKRPIRRVLEIGTSVGEGTRILAELFPHAEIVTVDLPDSDPLARSFYKRQTEEGYNLYKTKQAENTNFQNVHLVKTNSFFLPSHTKGPFDFVWIDGGHLLPDVAWDMAFAWNLASHGGIIMCDDVIPEPGHKNTYASSESAEILRYISVRTGVDPILFIKRRSPYSHWPALKRKYVSYVVKSSQI
jgi:Predicted O-methyltransferase